MVDTSTIPVTIGLDVLDALLHMASPKHQADDIMLRMAMNAAAEARVSDYDDRNIHEVEAPMSFGVTFNFYR